MRDVVVGDVPVVLKQGELYVTAAFAGACTDSSAQMHICLTFPTALSLAAGDVGSARRLHPVWLAPASL